MKLARLTKTALVPLIVATCTLMASVSSAQEDFQLPDIGSSAGAVVAEHEERAYGRSLMREFHRRAQTVNDPLINAYIDHLGYQLVSHSNDAEREFTFFVVDNDAVNAFAAPGGYIGIHSQLILEAEKESELAGVMAHEVAHVTQRHIARAIEAQSRLSLPMTLLMLGAIVAGAQSGNADAIQAGVIGSQAVTAQLQINFTRHNEQEADRVGIQILSKAGFEPIGMADFFGRMQRISRNYGRAPSEFLRTHPVESSRIAEAKSRAEKLTPNVPADYDADNFLFMRERVRVLTAERPAELIPYYLDQIDQHANNAALRYGLGLAQLESNDPIAATESFERLPAAHQGRLIVQLARAKVLMQSGSAADASGYQRLVASYPGNLAVTIGYAEALGQRSNQGDAAQAERLLRPLAARYPGQASLQLSYARAADRAGFPIRAGEAYAQQMYLHGRIFDSVTQLENLAEHNTLDYYQRSRIEARLADLRPLLAEIDRERGWDPSEGRDPQQRRRLQSNFDVSFAPDHH